MNVSYKTYATSLSFDCILGIVLGLIVNKVANYIVDKLNLSSHVGMVLQLFLIINVLYLVKLNSPHLHSTWHATNAYGIVFLAFFLGSQSNLSNYISYLGNKFE